jgi:hypothetical protein
MAALGVVLIILGCVAFLYFKGTLVKAFAMLITAVCASMAAFSYFELLANVLINRDKLVLWAQPISFVLLFLLAFAILQLIAAKLTRKQVDLGTLPERIGRVVCGIFVGLIVSGILLTALAMAPLPSKYPYQRFDATRPDAENPNKAFLNADGFAAGWFNIISSGSFSGKRSFATLHPAFSDQAFLNRHVDGVSTIASAGAINVPKKKAVWPAPEGLKDSSGKPVPLRSGQNLTIVRVGLTDKAIKGGGTFTLAQLRVICRQKTGVKNPLAGKGKNIYPIGYLKTENQLRIKQLDDQIKIQRGDFEGKVKWVDFAFYVPNDFLPVLVEFKQDNIAELPTPVTYEQAPPAASLIPLSECSKDVAKVQPIGSAKIHGLELAAGSRLLVGIKLEIDDVNDWLNAQTDRSIRPAQFEEDKTSYVRAELKVQKTPEGEATRQRTWREREAFGKMFKPLSGYQLLSLKCNNPSGGAAIRPEQLPVLIELSGLVHRPVGIVASAEVGDQIIYEIDYCSLTADETPEGLTFAEDSSVAKPFPDTIWLPERARSIDEFYVLYLVKSDRNAIITSVQPAGSRIAAGFEEYEGFSVK